MSAPGDAGDLPECRGWVEFASGGLFGLGADGWPIFPEDYDWWFFEEVWRSVVCESPPRDTPN